MYQGLAKYKPGSDLMSKLILDDKQVNNIIVRQIIGQHALNQYVSRPTEWLNFTKSDVLYTSKNSNSLPPIVVEVQYTGNMTFYRRFIDYGLSKKSFLLELPCHGWTNSCYLVNSSSIYDHLQLTSLNPLVALGRFLNQQKPSLRLINRSDDKTIQLIYTIAKQILSEGLKENEPVITAEELDEIHDQCKGAKSYLFENVQDESSRKRNLDCLDQVLIKINDPRKKPTGSVPSNNIDDPLMKDWQFVDKYYKDHGPLNWEAIFQRGKAEELFGSYSICTSVKSAYYRFQKQKQ